MCEALAVYLTSINRELTHLASVSAQSLRKFWIICREPPILQRWLAYIHRRSHRGFLATVLILPRPFLTDMRPINILYTGVGFVRVNALLVYLGLFANIISGWDKYLIYSAKLSSDFLPVWCAGSVVVGWVGCWSTVCGWHLSQAPSIATTTTTMMMAMYRICSFVYV